MRKTCKKCGFTADEKWFTNKPRKSAICPMCQQETRDKHKSENRATTKARRIIYSHAKKFSIKPIELIKKFGWDIKRIVHDINRAYENSCPYCYQLYKQMGNGLRDITLDIVNPNKPPYYSTNTKLCCSTCNSIKGQRGVDTFGLHLVMVQQRQEYLNAKEGTELKPQYRMEFDSQV